MTILTVERDISLQIECQKCGTELDIYDINMLNNLDIVEIVVSPCENCCNTEEVSDD